MRRLLSILLLCVSSVMAQQVVDTDIVHFLQSTEKCISYDETGTGATVAVFIDDDCDNVRDATEMYLSQSASFIWLNDHTFFPASDQVAVTIQPSGSASLFDLVQMFDIDGSESFSVTSSGKTSLGDPPNGARLNIEGAPGITATAPDGFPGKAPLVWLRADDCTQADGVEAFTVPERSTGNTWTAWTDGFGTDQGVIVRHNAINGHKVVEQISDTVGTDLALAGNVVGSREWDDAGFPAGLNVSGDFTALVVYNFNTATGAASGQGAQWILNAGTGQPAIQKTGFIVPQLNDDAGNRAVMIISSANAANTCTLTKTYWPGNGAGGDLEFDQNITRIQIIRRTGGDVSDSTGVYVTKDGDGKPGFIPEYCGGGSCASFDLCPDAGITQTTLNGRLTFNMLFNAGSGNGDNADGGFWIAEIVVYDSYLTDTEMQELYQYEAQLYGLTALDPGDALGAAGNIVNIYDRSNDHTLMVVEGSGEVGIGDNLSPATTLHVSDTTEQLRLEYNDGLGTNYCGFTVSSGGDLSLDCTGNNVIIEGVDSSVWDAIRAETDDNSGSYTALADADFDDSGDINFVPNTATAPDQITGLVRADSVALTTDTTGNYVASVATTAPLTGGAAGSEGTAITLALTQNAGTDVTADLEEEAHCAEHDSATSGNDCSGEVLVFDPTEVPSGTWGAGDFTTFTFSGAGGIDISMNGAASNTWKVFQSDSEAAGPVMWLQQISGSPTTGDIVGEIDFVGRNTTPADQPYAAIKGQIDSANSANPIGSLLLGVAATGTISDEVLLTSVAFAPATNDGSTLGSSSLKWGDLFLANLAVLNWNSGDCTTTHGSNALTYEGTCRHDFGGEDAVELPNGTGPTVNAAGEIAQDIDDDQLLYGAAPRVLSYMYEKTITVERVADSDNIPVMLVGDGVTVQLVGCTCVGTCSTMATPQFEDAAGDDIGSAPTCVARTSTATFTDVSADADGVIVAGSGLYIDITNTPSPNGVDTYMFTVRYTINRQ